MPFLPNSKTDLKKPGEQLDIIIVSGDAYIDHPSFGAAVIARSLEAAGFTVGIIDQPDWKKNTDDLNQSDFAKLGKPKLFFGVTAGNLDSMVANYTADKKIRRTDMYSPNNEAGHRPDRATIVYTNKIKQLFPDSFVLLGGVEGSLRRFAHYDFWDDKVRRSILFDSKADLLVYGMAEVAIVEVAKRLKMLADRQTNQASVKLSNLFLTSYCEQGLEPIANTVAITKQLPPSANDPKEAITLPSFEEVQADKDKYLQAFKLYNTEGRKKHPRVIIQPCQGRYLVVFPPKTMTTVELDNIFKLPFTRAPHPKYAKTPIPAWDFVKFSTISHRGCFGGCAFCAISEHQGKYIVSRSEKAIEDEIINVIMKQKDFTGTILDVGGPSANMYRMECKKSDGCTRESCIYPDFCPNLDASHKPLIKLFRDLRRIPGIKHIFSNSGIRYDLALKDDEYIKELVENHVSGQLSVAPEHICEEVLLLMRKPKLSVFKQFQDKFKEYSQRVGKEQYLIPYFISSHPGTTLSDALQLSLYLINNHLKVEQVQNFTPTPMTPATTMYYTGKDPATGKTIHIPKGEERTLQKALLQPHLDKNKREVIKALTILKKRNLIKTLLP
jgi:uncharacterized radical SAM protein YgiQ